MVSECCHSYAATGQAPVHIHALVDMCIRVFQKLHFDGVVLGSELYLVSLHILQLG